MTVSVLDGNGALVQFDAEGTGTALDPFRMKLPSAKVGPVHNNLSRRLDEIGDGTGNYNQNVDGSVTPVAFKIKPAPGEIIRLACIIVFVQDGGTFDSGLWANGITLANGIEFKAKRNGVISGSEQFNVKNSGDMSSVCFDYDHVNHGSGDEYCVWRYTFEKSGNAIRLVGDDDDEYSMVINDDITGVSAQYGTVQGYYE